MPCAATKPKVEDARLRLCRVSRQSWAYSHSMEKLKKALRRKDTERKRRWRNKQRAAAHQGAALPEAAYCRLMGEQVKSRKPARFWSPYAGSSAAGSVLVPCIGGAAAPRRVRTAKRGPLFSECLGCMAMTARSSKTSNLQRTMRWPKVGARWKHRKLVRCGPRLLEVP